MKSLLFSLITLTLFIFGVFLVIIFNSSPIESGSSVLVMFFIFSFLLALSVSFSVAIFLRTISKKQFDRREIGRTLRRCVELSIFSVGLLALSSLDVLNIVSLMAFFITIVLIEILLENRSR